MAERAKILVVDDEPVIRTLLEDTLTDAGYSVETAPEAKTAMEKLRADKFDLAILDYMMPEETGIDLLRRIKEEGIGVGVIILTAYASLESSVEALRLGAEDYLSKPINRDLLLHSIETVLSKRRLKSENAYLVKELRRRVERLNLISQMGVAITSTLDIDKVIRNSITVSKKAVNGEAASLLTIDEITGELEFKIAQRPDGRDDEKITGLKLPPGQGIAGWVAQNAKPVLVEDASNDPRFYPGVDKKTGEVTRSLIAVPLKIRDRVIGVIEVINKQGGGHFDKSDVFFVGLVANSVAVAIDNARLTAQLKASHAQLQAHNELLEQKVAERTSELTKANEELKKTNEELVATQNRLVQSEKLASVGQLAAGVAHEINNPLGYIKSNLATLGEYLRGIMALMTKYEELEAMVMQSGEPQLAAYAKTIKNQKEDFDVDFVKEDTDQLLDESLQGVKRVARIVEGLKRFSHADHGKIEPVDVNRNIEETMAVAYNEIKYRAEVNYDFGDVPPVKANPVLLSQVFMNLLVNAAQAMDKWGRIDVVTRATGDSVTVKIADNGCGIEKENLGKIFDPFFTTKEVGVGTGLGLSITYGIIQKLGGKIEVESEKGKGTTFTLCLPAETDNRTRQNSGNQSNRGKEEETHAK